MEKLHFINEITGRGPFQLKTEKRPGAGRPNIVLVSFDMVPREFYLPRSTDLAPRTPNMDALKNEGVFYSNCYATAPLCSPSRASLFTGRYSYLVANAERYHDGQQEVLREEDCIYAEYLKAAGYLTRHFGKCHVGGKKFMDAFGENDSPWDRWSPPWYDDDGYQAFLKETLGKAPAEKGPGTKGANEVSGTTFRFKREIRGWPVSGKRDLDKGSGKANAKAGGKAGGNFLGGWVECTDGGDFPLEAVYPAYTAGKFLEALENIPAQGNSSATQNFYYEVDFFEPHQPFMIPSGLEAREKELRAQLKQPGMRNQPAEFVTQGQGPEEEPLVYTRYRRYWGLDEDTARDYLVANVLEYEILDLQIGRIVSALKAKGLWENTLFILTADHGEMNCRQGLVDKGSYLNPRVLQVPLYVKWPTQGPEMAVCDHLVSLLDLAPTILQTAGIEALGRFDGRPLDSPTEDVSQRDISQRDTSPGARSLMAEVFAHVIPNPAAALISESGGDTCMYTCNFAGAMDELYLRKNGNGGRAGAWNEANLVNDKAQDSLRRRMLQAMDTALEADKRWSAYSAYFRLIHAPELGGAQDMQRFVR
jgi:arylsulfatase A-like enzyme